VTTPELDQFTGFLQNHGIGVVALLVIAFVAFRLVRPLVHRAILGILKRRAASGDDEQFDVEEADKRAATLEDLVSTLLRLTILLITGLVLLTWFDLLPVIAGLGVLAAAITLAGQSIVLDYLMGFLIVLEGPYSKGDWIQVGGVEGEVEEVGLRRTTIRDTTGTVHSVSNGEIRIASNMTRLYARMQVDMTVAFGTDLDVVTRVVNQVGREMAEDPEWEGRLLETPSLTRVPALGDLGVTLRVGGKVRATDRWTAPSELRRRLLVAFQANGIAIPVRGMVYEPAVAPTSAGTTPPSPPGSSGPG
jgi:small conductance mechanosensitive channel